jgi:hypothetical protein
MTKGMSLADLDASKASDVPFEFEYFDAAGEETGVFFQVLGDESPRVVAETQTLLNERRRKEAAAEIRGRTGGRKEAEFTPVEDDVAFGQRLTAVRLVGWRGINEPWTADLALQLIKTNRHVAGEVTRNSAALENFTRNASKV